MYQEQPLEVLLLRKITNLDGGTINDDEARNYCHSEWSRVPFRS